MNGPGKNLRAQLGGWLCSVVCVFLLLGLTLGWDVTLNPIMLVVLGAASLVLLGIIAGGNLATAIRRWIANRRRDE